MRKRNIFVESGKPHVELIPSNLPPVEDPEEGEEAPEPVKVEPHHFTDKDLLKWAEANRSFYSNEYHLSVNALQYWLRYTFESYTPEYKEMRGRLSEILKY